MQFNSSFFASTLLVIITISALNVEARHRRHHKRALVDDYDYRDSTDYTGGVFVDSVPMKTTTESKHLREHQKTNRFPKLRRFYADNSDRFFH
ncbi:hypothetical protein M3Y98_00470600 [Aphelenchoides besseyi]|nr:hypothetical protein M3Y98_00470600 [Aphelenchoides besseyi]KAI6207564.1 hypothetical protein M3Y96_00022400 [Aphelenchoides besseyi]